MGKKINPWGWVVYTHTTQSTWCHCYIAVPSITPICIIGFCIVWPRHIKVQCCIVDSKSARAYCLLISMQHYALLTYSAACVFLLTDFLHCTEHISLNALSFLSQWTSTCITSVMFATKHTNYKLHKDHKVCSLQSPAYIVSCSFASLLLSTPLKRPNSVSPHKPTNQKHLMQVKNALKSCHSNKEQDVYCFPCKCEINWCQPIYTDTQNICSCSSFVFNMLPGSQ